MDQLMELASPDQVQSIIWVWDYGIFRVAAEHNSLPVMERLMALAPNQVKDMIKADDFDVFRKSAYNNHVHIINRLLLFPIALAYAEQHEREYGEKYTHPFITQQLNLLRTQQATLETEHTHQPE